MVMWPKTILPSAVAGPVAALVWLALDVQHDPARLRVAVARIVTLHTERIGNMATRIGLCAARARDQQQRRKSNGHSWNSHADLAGNVGKRRRRGGHPD